MRNCTVNQIKIWALGTIWLRELNLKPRVPIREEHLPIPIFVSSERQGRFDLGECRAGKDENEMSDERAY
jgi:hypothetical protein